MPMRLIALSFCVGLFSIGSARGEIDIGAPAPPQPVPLKVRVPRGGIVEIPLRAFGIQNQQLRFRIRTNPTHGDLSEPKSYGSEVSAIIYRHAGEHGHDSDSFTYAVQSSVGISAPATVRLRIVDQPPIFVVPELVDSGEAIIGTAVRKKIMIENRGGGIVEGVAKVAEPWRLEKNGFRLRPGEHEQLTLIFQPHKEQEFTGTIVYSGDLNRSTALRGSGKAPIVVEPQQLMLQPKPGERVRRSVLQIINRTSEPQIVQIAASEKLTVPEQLELEPHRIKSLPIETNARGPVDGDLFLRAPGFHLRVPVKAPPAGAIFQAEPPQLSLGKLKRLGSGAQLKITNVGDSRGFLRAEIKPPFEMLGEREFALQPGEEKNVRVGLRTGTRSGRYRTWLVLKANDQRLELPVDAELLAQQTEPAATPVIEPKRQRQPAPRATPEPHYSDVPPVTTLRAEKVERRSAELAWKAPRDEPLQFQIEQRLLSLDENGELKIDWVPAEKITVRQDDQNVRARLRGLNAGQPYSLRIVSINQAGEHSQPSRVLTFQTQPKPKLRLTPLRVLLVIFAGLVAAIAWQRYRRQNE